MKIRFIIAVGLLLLVYRALSESGVLASLLMFLLIGQVPGTDYVLSPDAMLYLLAAVTSVLFAHIIVWTLKPLFRIKLMKELAKHRARLPRRRYTSTTAQS